MNPRTRLVILGALVVAAAAIAIALGLRAGGKAGSAGQRPGPRPPPPPASAAGGDAEKPAGAALALTREGLLAFLTTQAGPPQVSALQATYLFPEVRRDALEALALVNPAAATPLLQAALGGDGDPDAWPADRLQAALLRLRAGQADGAETVKAWLKAYPVPSEGEGAGAAAQAASWMGPVEGGAVLRQMLSAPLQDYDEDDLAAILQAAAGLGEGANATQLRAILASGLESWGYRVLGAAAAALRRLGDDSGQKVLDLAAADDWFEGDELAAGLAVRGAGAPVLWLDRLLGCGAGAARAQAARALRTVGDAGAVPMLLPALDDEDPNVQAEAAISLVALGRESALGRVRQALVSSSDATAIDAWKLLATRGDRESKAVAEKLLATPLPPADDLRRGPALRKAVWAATVLLRAMD